MSIKRAGKRKKSKTNFSLNSILGKKMLRFVVKLLVFAIPLYVILIFDLQWSELQYFIANVTTALLSAIGIGAQQVGTFITIPLQNGNWGAFITWDCTGWKSLLALFALIMATEFSMRKKTLGLIVFLPILFVVNILRIAFMFWFVNIYDLAYFEVVHTLIWGWGLIIALLVFWLIWMRWAMRSKKNNMRK